MVHAGLETLISLVRVNRVRRLSRVRVMDELVWLWIMLALAF